MSSVTNKTIRRLLFRHFKYVDSTIKEGNYIECDFRQYSELVKELVSMKEYKHNLFLTGLCLSPFQWLNYDVKPFDAPKITNLDKIELDDKWLNYLKYINKLHRSNVNMERVILSATEKVKVNPGFNILKEKNLNSQFQTKVIFRPNTQDNSELPEPFLKEEIKKILKDINCDYSCYNDTKKAFLIVDKKDINEDFEDYSILPLVAFIEQFFQENFKTLPLNTNLYPLFQKNNIPQDFFAVCTEADDKWNLEFSLCANVSDFDKVRLWIVSENSMPKIQDITGQWGPAFSMKDFKSYINKYFRNAKSALSVN